MGLSLPEPKGHQRDVVFLNERGHCVVLGTAGSGKTTMAVHRAHYLATAPGIGGRTLLVTFNKALVTYLKGMGTAPPNLQIETYHTFARGYLAHRTRASVRIYKLKEKLVERALEEARARLPGRALVKRPLEFFLDELHWLVGHGVDRQTYVEGRTPRVGRASRSSSPIAKSSSRSIGATSSCAQRSGTSTTSTTWRLLLWHSSRTIRPSDTTGM